MDQPSAQYDLKDWYRRGNSVPTSSETDVFCLPFYKQGDFLG
ncbi:hypothetical protein MGWOODY_Mmi1361 [hydrothermal vent metagenome]|uniref:Uncharacterized protein n=1 Tax=hydrothermal vent metagenome TaxID=652676 RepID=A0A160VIS9_9ZZZZ